LRRLPLHATASVFLMVDLPLDTCLRFLIWHAIGIAVYALYGIRHSRLQMRPVT
jgi:APA family basic amino acid/polyamine antiporter